MTEDFETFWSQAREVRGVIERVFREVTGEELNLETAIRHYPVMALGVAAVAGGVIGWRAGRKSLKSLPPPTHEATHQTLTDELGLVLPKTVDQVRQRLPEIVTSEQTRAAARKWFSTAIEPRLRRNIDNLSDRLDRSISDLLTDDNGKPHDGHDVRLDDPGS